MSCGGAAAVTKSTQGCPEKARWSGAVSGIFRDRYLSALGSQSSWTWPGEAAVVRNQGFFVSVSVLYGCSGHPGGLCQLVLTSLLSLPF